MVEETGKEFLTQPPSGPQLFYEYFLFLNCRGPSERSKNGSYAVSLEIQEMVRLDVNKEK